VRHAIPAVGGANTSGFRASIRAAVVFNWRERSLTGLGKESESSCPPKVAGKIRRMPPGVKGSWLADCGAVYAKTVGNWPGRGTRLCGSASMVVRKSRSNSAAGATE
jgi:hypothetical protein